MLRRPWSGLPIDSNVVRPMTTAEPRVTRLKRLQSPRYRQGMVPPRPMMPCGEAAKMIPLIVLYRHLESDRGVRGVPGEDEVLHERGRFGLEEGVQILEAVDRGADGEPGKRAWVALELLAQARNVIVLGHRPVDLRRIHVRIDERVREEARPEPGEPGKELEKKSVARDVVWDAESDVGAALREVQAEHRLPLLIMLHVEREEEMARRKLARLGVARRPRADHQPPAHRVASELVDHPRDLVIVRSARRLARLRLAVDREMAPEVAVRARHASALVGQRIPEPAAVLLEKADMRVAAQEPQVLDDDILPRDLFRREQREPLAKIDLVVDVERRERVDTRAVGLSCPFRQNFSHEVEICLHVLSPNRLGDRRCQSRARPGLPALWRRPASASPPGSLRRACPRSAPLRPPHGRSRAPAFRARAPRTRGSS